jgi:hypothetical protein
MAPLAANAVAAPGLAVVLTLVDAPPELFVGVLPDPPCVETCWVRSVVYVVPYVVAYVVAKVLPPFVVDVVTVVVMVVVTTVSFPFTAKIPPSGTVLGGEVEFVAFEAFSVNAASVLPVAGALIEATMPDWQWAFVVCAQ